MKRNPKRTLLAWLLTAAMLVSLLPTAAFAASGEAEEESAAAEQTEELTPETVSDEGYQLTEDSEAATSGTIPDNAVEYNGHYYYLYEEGYTWAEAEAYCESLGGYLATITSEDEQAFIDEYNSSSQYLWIGGYREDDDTVWMWVTGETWDYTNWGDGEPNNSSNVVSNENRTVLWSGGYWNDLNDENTSESAGYICEWGDTETKQTSNIPDSAEEYNGHYYMVYDDSVTWTEAEAQCEALGGYLATITSEDEQAFIDEYNSSSQYLWIGGYREDDDTVWMWVTGETWDYTNWGDGEPNNSSNVVSNENRTVLWSGGYWNDLNDENTSESAGYICEWGSIYNSTGPDVEDTEGSDYTETEQTSDADGTATSDSDFDLNIYRAEKLLDESLSYNSMLTQYMEYTTPSGIYVPALQESGFTNSAATWETLTSIFDTVDNVSNLYDLTVEEKDIYSAIILNILEASTEYGLVDTADSIISSAKSLTSEVKDFLKINYNIEIIDEYEDWNSLSSDAKALVQEGCEEYFKKAYPKLSSVSKVFKNLGTAIDIADNLESYLEYVGSAIALYEMSDALKTVISTMYQKCPSSNYAMKLALADCVEIINSSLEMLIFDLTTEAFAVAGVEIGSKLVDELWKDVKSVANLNFPYLDIIMAGYKTGKLISNTLFSTDSTVEQYYKMLAILEVEDLLDDVYDTLLAEYQAAQDSATAAAYLSSIDVIFNAVDYDCQSAYAFVDVLDDSLVSRIYALFSQTESDERASIKSSIAGIQSSYTVVHEQLLTFWIYYLETDYPNSGLYEQYSQLADESLNRILTKKYVADCPVDVYVYDEDDNLVAYVIENEPYSSGNVTVLVEGDKKTLYFYNDEQYRIEYVGNDTGTMDVTITEYNDAEEEQRNVYFYDVKLADGLTYEIDVTEQTLDEISYELTAEDGTISPDLDTYQPETNSHTVTMSSGHMIINGELFFETTAYAGEQISIYAYVPEGYEFASWTSDAGEDIFADASSQSTILRVPDTNVTVTAVLTAVDDGTAHTHSWTGAVTAAATCTTDGVMTYTCSCGDSYTETIPATGHTWDDGTVTLAATRVSEGEKTYTCTACGETKTEVIPVLTTASFLFSDVTNEESWYYSAVYWAYDLEITAGYDDGTFRPNSNCTRAEFTTFLYALANAYGLENAGDTASTSFTDVKSGSWYYTYVMWAAENGLVSGYSDGTFKPNNQITRAEAVTMLYGFYKSFVNGGQEPTVTAGESGFSDLSDTAWYYTYMAWATQNGVVSGYTDGTCRPNISCTRSVMVVLLFATADNLLT